MRRGFAAKISSQIGISSYQLIARTVRGIQQCKLALFECMNLRAGVAENHLTPKASENLQVFYCIYRFTI